MQEWEKDRGEGQSNQQLTAQFSKSGVTESINCKFKTRHSSSRPFASISEHFRQERDITRAQSVIVSIYKCHPRRSIQ